MKKLLFIFLLGCEQGYHQVYVERCKISCYEKGNDEPIFSASCRGHAEASIKDETHMKGRLIIKSHFLDVYRPFEKISQNKDKYQSCILEFSSEGRYR